MRNQILKLLIELSGMGCWSQTQPLNWWKIQFVAVVPTFTVRIDLTTNFIHRILRWMLFILVRNVFRGRKIVIKNSNFAGEDLDLVRSSITGVTEQPPTPRVDGRVLGGSKEPPLVIFWKCDSAWTHFEASVLSVHRLHCLKYFQNC